MPKDRSSKDERLQIRIDRNDKEWFSDYCKTRGGMSNQIQTHIRQLRSSESEGNSNEPKS
jgi:hypothetical protein